MQNSIHLTGTERFFDPSQIIVSKTDPKGKITYANDLFLSIADYQEHEVLGQPHNIIRHPHMPRCIYELLWKTVTSGEELFAYVMNRTKFGDHYWVLAHVTPTFDPRGVITGFHSSRRVPSRNAITQISDLYQNLRAEEERHSSPKDGLKASSAMLQAHLARHGVRYDQYIFQLINIKSAA